MNVIAGVSLLLVGGTGFLWLERIRQFWYLGHLRKGRPPTPDDWAFEE